MNDGERIKELENLVLEIWRSADLPPEVARKVWKLVVRNSNVAGISPMSWEPTSN
jgi:hypothetical protein